MLDAITNLFSSKMKFDSGTGWPSFFESYKNAFETSTDYKLIYPRTEYHCCKMRMVIMDIYLMTVQNPQIKDIAIMELL